MSGNTEKRLYTPAEVAAELHPAISEYDIRRRVRQGEIDCVEGSKRRVLFTRPQIEALLQSMTKPARPKLTAIDPVAPEAPNVFGATDRSHRRSQRTG